MSLIFGIFHRDQQTVDTANLAAMSSALAAYGPAGEGLWHDGAVGLGRRLLPFTATDDGPWEPVTDGRRVLAFAGQIYNREELINRFHLISEPAHPLSDPELLLGVLAARGEAGLPFVAGYFSFAWWQPEKQELLIGRSPLSAPPLFYHQFGANLAFAGMRKGLFALPWVPRALDETVLARYLIMAPIPPEQGFYREIAQLPPGHLLRANPEAVSTERYWQPDRQQTIYYPRDDDYVMAFNELFAQVIGEQIADSGKIGIMLSGGLDSSAVAAVAAPVLDATGAELTAFTEVPPPDFAGLLPPNRYADETPFVQAIAAMLPNLRVNLVRPEPGVYLDGLADFFNAAEVPFRNASNRLYIEAILFAARKQGIQTLLTGNLGNLTISWHGAGLLVELLRAGRVRRAWQEAGAMRHGRGGRLGAFVARGLLPALPPGWWGLKKLWPRGSTRTALAENGPINPDLPAEWAATLQQETADSGLRAAAQPRTVQLEVLQGSGLFEGLSTGYEALFQTRMLAPTIDPRLVTFLLALPETQYLRLGQEKWLLRRAMHGRLPPAVLNNSKRGLQTADWYQRLYRAQPQLQEALTRVGGSDLARRLLNLPRLRHLVTQMPAPSAAGAAIFREYRFVLEIGLMTGMFIAWAEEQE